MLGNNSRIARIANPTAAIAFKIRVGKNWDTAPPANAPKRLVNTNAPAVPKNLMYYEPTTKEVLYYNDTKTFVIDHPDGLAKAKVTKKSKK